MTNTSLARTVRAAPFTLLKNKEINESTKLTGNWELPAQTELLILWAIGDTPQPGVYGLDIQRAFEECSAGRESISLGSLYSTLKRLRKKGYVDSVEGDALGGGAKRQYYHLTESGKAVARNASEFYRRLQQWQPQ